jgi:hypothetical protein
MMMVVIAQLDQVACQAVAYQVNAIQIAQEMLHSDITVTAQAILNAHQDIVQL